MMKSIINGHALNSLLKPVNMPAKNLGVADDECLTSIPLLIFTEQHLPMPTPVIQPLNYSSYEKAQRPGAGNVLSLEDFETENFNLGHPFGGDR